MEVLAWSGLVWAGWSAGCKTTMDAYSYLPFIQVTQVEGGSKMTV